MLSVVATEASFESPRLSISMAIPISIWIIGHLFRLPLRRRGAEIVVFNLCRELCRLVCTVDPDKKRMDIAYFISFCRTVLSNRHRAMAFLNKTIASQAQPPFVLIRVHPWFLVG